MKSLWLLCGLFGLLLIVLLATPVLRWHTRWLSGSIESPEGDILVVLAAADDDLGALSYSSYWRTVYALNAIRAHPYQRVILSGGNKTPVAESMKEFLVANGVQGSLIEADIHSSSTRLSAEYLCQALRSSPGAAPPRVVLLTSDFHMRRARAALRRCGLETLPRVAPDALKRLNSPSQRLWVAADLWEETGKLVYYKMRGWL